ncbi:hypothetical protein AMS68_005101 [Peltaster fructicola]|uniref:Uncharacterized protein n=1 Tax=Peltaster fructicola TaxID=286661 RepID=A0A6H0XXX5_9PEZI|nr:hypothetical protein AMS68_005101 [Peltaster fructicola]
MGDSNLAASNPRRDAEAIEAATAVLTQPQSDAAEDIRAVSNGTDPVDDTIVQETSTKPQAVIVATPYDGGAGADTGRKRWQDKVNPFKSTRIPEVPSERAVTREETANLFSILGFQWIFPLISTGYKRPLELNDIWTVSPQHKIDHLAPRFKAAFEKRKAAVQWKPDSWHVDPLILAMVDCSRKDLILSTFCAFMSGTLQVLTPFVLRYLILFVQAAYDARHNGAPSPAIGSGIGLAVGIALMKLVQAICLNHYYLSAMRLGGKLRATMIATISEKSMKLSGRAKVGDDTHEGWSNGRINNLMSTDTSRIDQVCMQMHRCWLMPLQVLLALALLCINLTYSALVGFGLICTVLPLLSRAAKRLNSVRGSINKLTDERIQLTQEAFSAIRVVKIFAWETKLQDRLAGIRKLETQKIALLMMIRNAMLCAAMLTTSLASVLSFITYYLSNHELSAAPIFSSLALFNALGTPIEMLPMAIGRIIDAYASIKRIAAFLDAEEMLDETAWEPENPNGIVMDHAEFSWDYDASVPATAAEGAPSVHSEKNGQIELQAMELDVPKPSMSLDSDNGEDDSHFRIRDINLAVGRSELIAVIGSVGSGKSSLLSALGGDMRKVKGSVVFGGSRAFCSQVPWIQNATLRQNITFGKPFDKKRYDDIIKACALQADLDMLPAGDFTEIGERGITLSGGQKQRLNIARAIYSDTDVVLLDDPLSAVDAHVGQHIMDHAICGLLRTKCRILATHQLHFLRRADRIVWLKNGMIYKTATYSELMENDIGFQILMETTAKSKKAAEIEEKPTNDSPEEQTTPLSKQVTKVPATALMQQEDRASGSVNLKVYQEFVRASGSSLNSLLVLFLITVAQAVVILSSLWLSWWTSGRFALPMSTYIGVYAGLGMAGNMLGLAIARAIRAPVSFFDTTPLGRITNRFSKDIDTVDNALSANLCFAGFALANIISIFALAIAYYYYFAVALVPLSILFVVAAAYYRRSAREIKRHESVLRSTVFSKFGETITGTTTIRAYNIQHQFQKSIADALDSMNGAYFLTFAGQRWLTFQLDAVACVLILVIGILIVTGRFDINPSIGGLVLGYMLSIGILMQESVHVVADVQNDMNSVERLYHYINDLEQEAPAKTNLATSPSWPAAGAISFRDVKMRYRPSLPLVLKGLSFEVKPGERIGIVGRTGAGKSSIMVALFRLAEVSHGTISIDDVDISRQGLYDLRSRLAMIPQDPTLFRGTIRSNLDPFDEHEDLVLWNALRQADLLDDSTNKPKDATDRITLDSVVEEEGHNFSLGQRQLLALARVLVKDTRIVICDEATSSVDFETDLRVQRTMLRAFKGKTLLCIAHRLKTIIGYDRILVVDAGTVADFDTPLALFDQGGSFRSMCERSGITRHDLLQRDEARLATSTEE